MEMASFLAGERWSDHPACTHRLLAFLARMVNDVVTDPVRPQLVPMIPSVIGLTSNDLRVDATIALRAAVSALPVAAHARQRSLATAVLVCERVLAELDGRDLASMSGRSRQVLDQVPEAEAWARSFSSGSHVSHRAFRARTAPNILGIAVDTIAASGVPDVEQRLVDLLAASIADSRALIVTAAPPAAAPWEAAPREAGHSAGQ